MRDEFGMAFGRWTVLQQTSDRKHYWVCKCSCGTIRLVKHYDLIYGTSYSCGCARTKPKPPKVPHPRFHHMTNTPVWNIWRGMIQRCRDKNQANYKNYGAKGITVCERWTNFKNFFTDMGSSWSEGLEIERKNGLLGYSPKNCIWATRREQMNNMSRNVILNHNGEKRTVSEWARLTGIRPGTINARIRILGWNIEHALTVKPRFGNRICLKP